MDKESKKTIILNRFNLKLLIVSFIIIIVCVGVSKMISENSKMMFIKAIFHHIDPFYRYDFKTVIVLIFNILRSVMYCYFILLFLKNRKKNKRIKATRIPKIILTIVIFFILIPVSFFVIVSSIYETWTFDIAMANIALSFATYLFSLDDCSFGLFIIIQLKIIWLTIYSTISFIIDY